MLGEAFNEDGIEYDNIVDRANDFCKKKRKKFIELDKLLRKEDDSTRLNG